MHSVITFAIGWEVQHEQNSTLVCVEVTETSQGRVRRGDNY